MQRTLRRSFKLLLYIVLAVVTFATVFFFGESSQVGGRLEKGAAVRGFGASVAYADGPVASFGDGGGGTGSPSGGEGGSSGGGSGSSSGDGSGGGSSSSSSF